MKRFRGIIIGTGIGFGSGLALGLYTMGLVARSGDKPPFIFVVIFFVMFAIPAIVGGITRSCLLSVIFYCFISGLPLGLFLAITLGGEDFAIPAPIFLSIPFTVCGGIIGHKLSAKRKPRVNEAEDYEQGFEDAEQGVAGEQEEERYDEEDNEFEAYGRVDDTYYDILGVAPDATKDEIKKAYREKIKEYHPDKFMDQPEWVRKEAEEMSKKLNEAYEALMEE